METNFKKWSFLVIGLVFSTLALAQANPQNKNQFQLNIYISADKEVYVENEKTNFQDLEEKVATILRNRAFKLDESTCYKIFADEKLPMGFIIGVTGKLLSANRENVEINRYLLNSMALNIDGENWLNKINMKELKKLN